MVAEAKTYLVDIFRPNLIKNFNNLIFDKYGSRVAELTITCADEVALFQLVQELTKDAVTSEKILADNSAHHSLIKIVDVCTDMTLLSLLITSICGAIEAVVMNGRSLIVVGIAQKLGDTNLKQVICGKRGSASEWNQCQTVLIESLKSFYMKFAPNGWSDAQKRDCFVVLVGAFYPRNFTQLEAVRP